MKFYQPSVLAAVLAAAMAGAPAQAQQWSGATPVYQSDIDRQAQAAEAARSERRASAGPTVYPKFMDGGAKPDIAPNTPPIVYFDQSEEPGSIIVNTAGKKLYYVLPGKKAYEYPISVGRDGFTWSGTERISRIAAWPTWTPPPEMHKRVPGLPITVSGGLKNPQGARALYLGNTIYRIHGTNNDRSIGRASSSGCFRMMNEHVVHLATLAKVGTKVRVVQAYTAGVSPNAPLSSLFGFGSDDDAAPAKSAPKKKIVKKSIPAKPAPAKSAAAAPAVEPAAAKQAVE